MYQRVIPRDLFNESKLLKCYGQLALLVHDGIIRGIALEHDQPETGFQIEQDPSSGMLYCSNLTFSFKGKQIIVGTCYNSKMPYPMVFNTDGGEEFFLFNNDGSLSDDFKQYIGHAL